MPMYNLLEYSDDYADSSGSLWQFKRDEQNLNDDGNLDNVTTADLSLFKYKNVPNVTLSTKDNVNLTKQLNEGFKRSVYWNEYK